MKNHDAACCVHACRQGDFLQLGSPKGVTVEDLATKVVADALEVGRNVRDQIVLGRAGFILEIEHPLVQGAVDEGRLAAGHVGRAGCNGRGGCSHDVAVGAGALSCRGDVNNSPDRNCIVGRRECVNVCRHQGRRVGQAGRVSHRPRHDVYCVDSDRVDGSAGTACEGHRAGCCHAWCTVGDD